MGVKATAVRSGGSSPFPRVKILRLRSLLIVVVD